MGWLFAVALGMQEHRRQAMWQVFPPLGAGHLLAVGNAITVATLAGFMVTPRSLRIAAAVALIILGITRLLWHRHPRLGGMRVGTVGLTLWSFLMASAHGAGLMVLPIVVDAGSPSHYHAVLNGPDSSHVSILSATLLHGAGYLLVTVVVAIAVFEKLGVGLLRTAWFNIDLVWAIALIATGGLTWLSL